MLPLSRTCEFQRKAFSRVLWKHVWTAHLLSQSGVDSHRLFFPCLVFSSQKLWCLSNEAQTHSGLLQPSRLGEIWLVEGRDSWKMSTMERFLGPNYPDRTVLNQESVGSRSEAGVFILDMSGVVLFRNRLEFKNNNLDCVFIHKTCIIQHYCPYLDHGS